MKDMFKAAYKLSCRILMIYMLWSWVCLDKIKSIFFKVFISEKKNIFSK